MEQPIAAKTEDKLARATEQVAVEERLLRIEKGVDELRQLAAKDTRKEIEDKKKSSRSAVTVAFALIGAKIGAAIAGKGLIVTARNKEKGKAFADFKKEAQGLDLIDVVMLGFKKVFEFLETDFLKEIGSKAFIWGGVGAAIGAAIGWTRGDRIHDVHDLIKHPIDSLQKILGMKPKDPEPDPKAASATKVKAQELELPALKPEKPVDNLSAATTPWQNKVVAEQAQQEEAAVVVGATL